MTAVFVSFVLITDSVHIQTTQYLGTVNHKQRLKVKLVRIWQPKVKVAQWEQVN